MKAEFQKFIGSLPKNAIRRIGEFLLNYILKIEVMETRIEELKKQIINLQREIGRLNNSKNG